MSEVGGAVVVRVVVDRSGGGGVGSLLQATSVAADSTAIVASQARDVAIVPPADIR
jgi:hypothetical protein